jgi:hypothetical protein
MVAWTASSQWRTRPVALVGVPVMPRVVVPRLLIASLAVPLALLIAVPSALADTTGGGNGTNFSSFTETCSTSGGRQVCTDTNVQAFPDETGASQTCLDVFTYSLSAKRETFVSDQFGCAPTAGLTVGADYSVVLAPTDIPVQTCAAHKRQCSGATNVTVSAADSAVGDPSITRTRSTTTQGGCTFRTTTTETAVELAGTMTIGASSLDEQGFLDIFDSSSTVHCK